MSEKDKFQTTSTPTLRIGMRGPGFRGPGAHLGVPPEKPKNFNKTLNRLLFELRPFYISLLIVLLFTIFSTILAILAPKIMGKALTILFEGIIARYFSPNYRIDYQKIYKILFNLSLMYIVTILFNYVQQYIMAGVSQKLVKNLRSKMMNKLNKLPLKYYDSKTHGDILSRFINDIDTISSTLQQGLVQVFSSIISIIGVIIMMLTINPLLTLITILTLPLSIFSTSFIAKQSQKQFREQQKILGEINGHIEESFSGHIIIKSYNREKDSIDKFSSINEKLYNVGWKAQFFSGIIMPIMNFISNIGYVIIAVVGGIFVTKKIITIGDIQAFIQYSNQFTQPIIAISNIINLIQSTIAASERIFELLDEDEIEKENENSIELIEIKGKVKFNSVYFSYLPEKRLIEDFSLNINEGEMIAIVGPTGAGKTTLVNLIMRFYEINNGQILIDDINIKTIKRKNLRSFIGMVLQDTWLFNSTIKENIAYGKDGAKDEEIIEASKKAYAHHFISLLPDGYNTVINEESTNISVGEKQLITIARAFLKNPDILILDEATSNVDTLTEIHVQKAMKELMKGRTCFVIAHRLSTIKNADKIIVMNEGKIIETGTHEELLNKKGFYYQLYQSQFLGMQI
ncbi:MAG: ABC transporter ATP-binding protein/permease [Spirochaetes bacterium]|nr:ABC transporter ATP-binding protein/permease [Spirochaetota bacterium]